MENFFFEYLIDQIKKKNFKDVVIKTKESFDQYKEFPQFWNLRGVALNHLGYNSESIDCFLKSYELNKNFPGPLHNISLIFFNNKNYEKAIEFCNRCLEIQNNYMPALIGLMNSYLGSEQFNKCIEITNNLIRDYSDKIDLAFIYNVRGCCYESLQDTQTALENYNFSLEINPNYIPAKLNVANYHSITGNIELAQKLYKKLLDDNPELVEAHRRLTIITKYKTENDVHIKQMEKVFNENRNNDKITEELGFALSKSKEDVKNYKEAHYYFSISNEIRDKKTNYNSKFQEEEFDCITKIFSKLEKDNFKRKTNIADNVVFILGMPRSGTTLVEQIISSHPEVQGLEEIDFLSRSLTYCVPHKSLDEFYKKITENPEETFNCIEKKYFDKVLNVKKTNFSYHTDKMPVNYKLIGFIKHSIGTAKVIHCEREPRDVFLSILKNYFGKLQMSYAYAPQKLVHTLNLYIEYMHFWKKIYGNWIYDLKYHELVENSETEIKKILQFCNLSFSQKCIAFEKNKKSVSTASSYQVRQPIYQTSNQAWKNYDPYLSEYFNKLKSY